MRRSLSKKGVSPVIGYILLITFVIIISIIVYQWVKTYVPREALECPDGVSIFIKEKEVDCEGNGPYNYLNLTLKNNGRFNISGYFIRYSEDPGMLATKSLWELIGGGIGKAEGWISFDDVVENKDNSFGPGEEEQDNFTFGEDGLSDKISFIEIIPVRYEEIDNRLRLSSCGDAKITEVICDVVACDHNLDPCNNGAYTCGTAVDDGTCPDTTCGDNSGVCNVGFTCTDEAGGTCESTVGDGIIDEGEQCDDGCLLGIPNVCEPIDNGDGCDISGQIENGYACSGAPSICGPAPDLIVSGLALAGSSRSGNKYSVDLTYDVENILTATDSASDVNWAIDFGDGEALIDSATFPGPLLAGGKITDLPTGGDYSEDIEYLINVTVDYYFAILELSELNSATITVKCTGNNPNPCSIVP